MSQNLRGLSERKGLKNNLFGEIVNGSLTTADNIDIALKELSQKYLVGQSAILGTSSFYDFLRTGHKGKKVFICDGTACLTSGRQEPLRKALLERFNENEIGTVTCLGHCHTNHSFMHGHATHSMADISDIDEILDNRNSNKPEFTTGTNADKPPLFEKITDLREFYRPLKEYAGNIPRSLAEIEISGLRGRGGAGFPFHLKLKTAAGTESSQKYIVCNADEGDPGAFSDKYLLEERPHSLLFGMMLAGAITGADTGVVYIRGEYPESVIAVKAAIEQIEREELTSFDLPGTCFSFKFYVVEGAGAYICGEETSLLNSIEGLRPEVRTRPPFPAVYGLFGNPTVLSNVETFANISYILREGGAAFSALGTEKSAGTKLVSLDGAFVKPGLYEVRMGTPLSYLFNEMGGGMKYPVKAFQIGGPLGGIVPASKVKELSIDFESFSESGFLLGHAGVVSIPADFPMIKFLSHLFDFTAKESCGKCFPCRLGADHGSSILKSAVDDGEKINRELFSDLLETMQLGSLCALGGGLPLPVRNALHYFSSELEEYFTTEKINHG
jgi:NADH-quinone oxidoreductase subunit F